MLVNLLKIPLLSLSTANSLFIEPSFPFPFPFFSIHVVVMLILTKPILVDPLPVDSVPG
jgi:hypothetical protein